MNHILSTNRSRFNTLSPVPWASELICYLLLSLNRRDQHLAYFEWEDASKAAEIDRLRHKRGERRVAA